MVTQASTSAGSLVFALVQLRTFSFVTSRVRVLLSIWTSEPVRQPLLLSAKVSLNIASVSSQVTAVASVGAGVVVFLPLLGVGVLPLPGVGDFFPLDVRASVGVLSVLAPAVTVS